MASKTTEKASVEELQYCINTLQNDANVQKEIILPSAMIALFNVSKNCSNQTTFKTFGDAMKLVESKIEECKRNEEAYNFFKAEFEILKEIFEEKSLQYKESSVTAGKDAWFRSSTKVDIIQANIKRITGVTVVDDKIFVVGERQSQINVYDSHSLTASRDINIPDMKGPVDLAGCSYNKALYISDCVLHWCIHRVDLTNNSVTRWKMRKNHLPLSLSMTKEHNVLVTVWAVVENKYLLEEYTSEGQLVREIRLDIAGEKGEIVNYVQTVQLSSDQFFICFTSDVTPHRRLFLITTEGQIKKSCDGEKGGLECQSFCPDSIAIDYNSKHVFVADERNHRVLMLDTDLTYLGRVQTPPDLQRPHRLYFDSSTDRLFVSEIEGGRVLVISPSH